tara:strand:- start:290 stop:559 length:270 start_codon:yes stop_codon:yes gene_type:complete
MAYKRPAPEPKFKKGDLVKETKHIALQVNFRPADYKREARGIGTVIDVIVKKNRAGSRHFYYSVLWAGTKTESTHSQMRLALIEDTQSK